VQPIVLGGVNALHCIGQITAPLIGMSYMYYIYVILITGTASFINFSESALESNYIGIVNLAILVHS